MAGLQSISDLRSWAGDAWKNSSDEDIIAMYARQAKIPVSEVADKLRFAPGEGGMTAKRFTASGSNYLAGIQGVGEAVTGALGLTSAEEYLAGKRRANEVQARIASERAQNMGAVESYKEVDTVGKGLNYAGGLIVGSLPYAAEAITGGLGARAIMGGTRLALTEARAALQAAETAKDVGAAAKATQAVKQAERSLGTGSLAGGAAASYPSSVGDILQNQREQTGGQTNLGAAMALGVPYVALGTLGPEGALAKGSLFRNAINMLDRPGGVAGAAARIGATATVQGLKEGASETGQEMLNQVGRMAVDDKAQFFSEEAIDRYKESFVGGAVLGGALGGGLGGYRRSEGYQATGDIQQAFTQPQTGGTPTGNTQTGQTPPPAPPAGTTVVPPVTPNAPAGGTTVVPPVTPNAPAGGASVTGAPITPPVVSGGTTPIAQASANQTQADFAAQQQQAIQDKREKVIDQFGLRGDEEGNGSFFNRPIFGTNVINKVADALAPIADKLDKEDAAVMDAILQADKLTGGKLVSFKFNGDKIEQSVQQGVKAVLSVANKFQIGEVASVDEAGQILNTLSQSAKGAELEQINAIHQALTGKDTEGYIASQTAKTAKGKSNAQQQQQLPEQVPAGLGTVPEQGSAGQVDGGLTGLLQPGAVQPVGTGSVAGAAPDQQAGQPSGEGVRPSASIAADNGSDVLTVAPPQVTGTPSETSTVQTTAAQGGAVAPASVDGGGQISGQSSQATESDVDRPVVQRRKRRAIIGAQQYTPGLQYYASDLSHISSERRVEIVRQLLDAALTPKRGGANVIPAETRGEIARLALNEQFRMEQIAEFTGVSAEAVSKQLQRMGIALKDGEFQVVDPEFAKLLVATAEAFRSAEFPDGIGIVELKGLYSTRYEGETQSTGDLAEELQTAEPEGDRSKVLAEELYGGESGEGKSMGTIASAGSSQGAVDSAGARGLSKITKLQKQLDETPDTDVEGKANVSKQLAVAWEAYKKEQKARAVKGEIDYTQEEEEEQDLVGETASSKESVEEETTTEAKRKQKENLEQIRVARQAERKGLEVGDTVVNPKLGTGVVKSFAGNKEDTRVTVEFKSGVTKELLVSTAKLEKTNAVQVKSANEGDVREPAAGGEEVVKVDDKPKKPARTRKAKAESKPAPEAKEEVKTPEEQWSALAEQFPQMPPYATLDKSEKERWDDLVNRGVANLAAADKILSTTVLPASTVTEAAPVETTEAVVEPIAEATVEEEVTATPEVVEVTPEQQAILEEPVAALPEPQIQKLESHYDAKRGTSDFFAKLQADVVLYSTKGAEAVAGAIRSIIRAIHTGVLAVGMVFNPTGLTNNFDFNLPQTYKTTVTTQVKAKVPANAKAKMSVLAQSVYESMAPTAKASGKGFIIADKPNGMLHVFFADGTLLVQDAALYGKDIGDVEGKISSLEGGAKITPAGKFRLIAFNSPDYEGGKTLALAETGGDGIIAVHSVYLGDPKEKRLERLAAPGAEGKRISYGCINTKQETFLKSIIPNIDMLNGGMIFVLPDNQAATAAMFPAKTTTKVVEGTRQTATQVAARSGTVVGKEEKYLFGVARKVQNPYSAAELVADIKSFIRTDILGNKLIVVDSISDLIRHPDADVRAVAKAIGDKGAYGVAVNGKAFLIANRIEKGEGRAKFLHEVGAHLGLENLLPKAVYDKLTAQIDKWASSTSDSTESTLAKAAQARVEAANTPTEDRQAEMLAYFIEEAVQAGIDPTAAGKESAALTEWFRTLWAAFKTAIRRLGFKTEALTAQDVVNLAFGAARLEITGTWHGTAADFRRFNHSFMSSGEGQQAFGWGTYLAQRVGVAVGYWKADVKRKTLSQNNFSFNDESFQKISKRFFKKTYGKEVLTPNESSLRLIIRLIEDYALLGYGDPEFEMYNELGRGAMSDDYKFAQEYRNALRFYENNRTLFKYKPTQVKPEGSLMRVDTSVSDEEMIDWDAPFAEQSQLVQDFVAQELPNKPVKTGEDIIKHLIAKFFKEGGYSGSWYMLDEQSKMKVKEAASKYLDKFGIKGHKFLDQLSREPGIGNNQTRNVVIYDDKNIFRVGTEVAADKQRMKFGFAGEKGVRNRGMTDKQTTNMVTAKIMDANGELRSDIWYDTGWLRGVDNKWRTEFSDRDAKMTLDKVAPGGKVEINKPYRLGDVLSHLPLYRLYPELANYTISFAPDLPPRNAAFDPANKSILMSGQQPDDVATLLHEVQHAIQEIEGFGRGGSPENMDVLNVNAAEKFYKLSAFRAKTDAQEVAILNYYRAVQDLHANRSFTTEAKADAAFDSMLKELGVNEEQVKQEMYLLISGEVEARDVEARREYNNELRRQVVPGEGEGISNDMQLVFDKNTGTYKSIGKTLDTRAQEQVEKLPPKWQPAARTVTTTLMYTLKKAGLASMITEDVINAASKYMKSAQDYLTAQYARQATRLEHELKIDKILQQFDKLPENLKGTGKGSVNEYIHDSTRQGLWGYYPDARLVGTSMAQIDPEFKRRFNAFPDAAQKLIKAVFEQGHDSLAAKQKAVADAIDREYADRIAAVQGDAALTAEIEKEKNLRLAREAKLLGLDSSKPYAYLGRYGDYVVVGKSAEYKFHEEQAKSGPVVKGEYLYGADSRKWLEDNRSNPAHYVVQFAETLAEADQIAAQLNATGDYDIAESFEKEPYSTQGGELFTAVARLRSLYDRESEGADPQAAAAISNLLGDLYLHTVSEASARKSEFQRLNISGADKDMMRNLATRGRADAHFLAALKHNDSISDSLSNMRKERDRNRREAGPYFNELLKRHANSMEYQTPGGLATALQRMSTVWYLSTSPAFYLQQILQTGAISLPYMAGRLGYFRSARAVKRAYSDMATLTKGLGLTAHVDFSQAPADVRDMLKTLVGMGKIDIGIDYDARSRAGDTGVVASVMNKLQGVNNRIETINRATAAIAAYRGYLERYKNNDIAAATKYAADVVSNTHGSYDAFNTPRIMSGPAGKVLLQFKRFQIIQISMLTKLLNTAFKGASAQERTVARHSLAFVAGQMGVLGGVMAVPFAQQAASILSKVFGDPDEPDNWEYKLRQMIGDKAVADLLISGVPAAMGVDISGKVGLGNVFSILPYTDVDLASRSGAEKVLVGLMGPTANLGLKFADGVGLMAQGQYYKGLEQMLPNGVANLMKGTRFAAEGITMRNGDVVLKPDEISMLDAAFQAVGLPTNTITDRQFTQKVVKEFDKYYAERTTEIKGDYVKASRSGDSAAMSDARDEWVKLQESRIANGYKRQPYSELYRAPMEALKRERNTAGGVEFGKSNRRLVESLSTI